MVPGGGLCSGRPEAFCKPGIFEWDDLSGLWIFYGIYADFYGFLERRMVLSVFGMSNRGNCD